MMCFYSPPSLLPRCLRAPCRYVLTPAVLVPAAAVLVGCSAPVKSLLFPVRVRGRPGCLGGEGDGHA